MWRYIQVGLLGPCGALDRTNLVSIDPTDPPALDEAVGIYEQDLAIVETINSRWIHEARDVHVFS